MGGMENGTPEPESNIIETKKIAQDQRCEPLTPENKLSREAVEKKDTEAQNIEKKLVSIQESSTEVRPSQFEGIENREPLLQNVKTSGNLEGVSQNGSIDLTPISVSPSTTSDTPGDATNNVVYSENEDRGLSGEPIRRQAKLKRPVTSSWSLRSKSQEKPKAPEPTEPTDAMKEGSANAEKKKRGRKKKQQMQKNTANEFSRFRSHLRYLLHRINFEQNLIDAYSAEGWRGQSLDKLKPEKELEKAKSHILRYKLKIRALFQQLDAALAAGKIPESLFDSQGEIDSEDIFCAKCGSKDLTLENDIILCDGACERGFHQFCLEPPLLKKDIPPGDESWLCPGCDCKVDCIDILKDFQGTKISILDSWEKIFPEAAAAASGNKLDDGSGSASDDSEDEEYDPDKPDEADIDENGEGDDESSSDESYVSASDDLKAPLDNNVGLPSDDSEDDDFDPSGPSEDNPVKQDSSSSDFSSDSEDLEALLDDEVLPGKDVEQVLPPADHKLPSTSRNEETSKVGKGRKKSLKDELSYLIETSVEPVSSRRHVERLDYKKLHDETYGNSSSDSSDEDFDFDDTTRKRTRTGGKKTKVEPTDKTPITTSNINTNGENQTESKQTPIQTCNNNADGGKTEFSGQVGSASTGTKKSKSRLGEAIIQKLHASFKVNQYPERAVKENLANELGIAVRQVSKWFENARWSYNHRPKVEPNSTEKPPEPVAADNGQSNRDVQQQELAGTSPQNHVAGVKEENPVTNTSGEHSGTQKTRKRKGMSDHAIKDTQSAKLGTRQRQTRRSSSGS